eukprot:8121643-Ditylum_brightwellii.AAC.3
MAINTTDNGEDAPTVEETQLSESEVFQTDEENTANLPAPKGLVAKQMNTVKTNKQKEQVAQVFEFQQDSNPNFVRLNVSKNPTVALVCLSNSGKIKVLYGLGYGYSGIGGTVETDGKMLALTGEGGSKLGPLHPLVLESTITTTCNTICPQALVFKEKVSASTTWPMFQTSTITDQTSAIMQIAPIPAFFMYDELEKIWTPPQSWQELKIGSTQTRPTWYIVMNSCAQQW